MSKGNKETRKPKKEKPTAKPEAAFGSQIKQAGSPASGSAKPKK